MKRRLLFAFYTRDLIGNIEGIIRLSPARCHLMYDVYIHISGNAFLQIHSTYICICSGLYLDVVSISSCIEDARACTYESTHTDVRRVSLASLTTVHSMGKYWLHIMHSNTRVHTRACVCVCVRVRVIAVYLFANNTQRSTCVSAHSEMFERG